MTDFEIIYSEYFADVYKYALLLCHNETIAEEITQETFFKALKNIDKFKGECKIRVWLCQITKNTYFSLYQKSKNTIVEAQEDEVEYIEQKLINSETVWEVHKMLHFLDEPYKEVFTLRVFGELPFLQIAELFGKTESWARVTFHRQIPISYEEGLVSIKMGDNGVLAACFNGDDYYCSYKWNTTIEKDGIKQEVAYVYYTDTIWKRYFSKPKKDREYKYTINNSSWRDYDNGEGLVEVKPDIKAVYYMVYSDLRKMSTPKAKEDFLKNSSKAVLLWEK